MLGSFLTCSKIYSNGDYYCKHFEVALRTFTLLCGHHHHPPQEVSSSWPPLLLSSHKGKGWHIPSWTCDSSRDKCWVRMEKLLGVRIIHRGPWENQAGITTKTEGKYKNAWKYQGRGQGCTQASGNLPITIQNIETGTVPRSEVPWGQDPKECPQNPKKCSTKSSAW